MDPFNIWPAGLRFEILVHSKRSVSQFIQASPTMLRQYMVHREYITRKMFTTTADLDSDMVQDAIAIIPCPARTERVRELFGSRPHQQLEQWRFGQFHDPLRQNIPLSKKDYDLLAER
ncbi:hypothetical protein F5Y18DRAFT_144196 [Xylariaceae sp. FL1019]|nr:hypothetical protein F5Y18DRAFT_144196 [Xylariaceae sp. FL1019]